MKYLLIPIECIPQKHIDTVLIAVADFRDERDLKVDVDVQIVHFVNQPARNTGWTDVKKNG